MNEHKDDIRNDKTFKKTLQSGVQLLDFRYGKEVRIVPINDVRCESITITSCVTVSYVVGILSHIASNYREQINQQQETVCGAVRFTVEKAGTICMIVRMPVDTFHLLVQI
jgi:hypothetical protein